MKVTYDTEDLDFSLETDESLLDACLRNKVPISHSCEGMASCGTCRVIVTSGLEDLPLRNSLEQDMASDRKFADCERLACQLEPLTSLSFKLPQD